MDLCLQTNSTLKKYELKNTMILQAIILATFVITINGHGRLISPPGRSTMWRYGYNTPANYDDNQMSCGGFYTQWTVNGGKCGVCGDPWNSARQNEVGGKYATGRIVGRYTSGQTIQVKVQVTATHKGYFEFRLCPVNNRYTKATQACFDRYLLKQTNGQTRFREPGAIGTYTVDLVLPRGLTCSQCVLQWKWNTGNSYNCDGNNKCCIGCGPQEQFYGCADIAISSSTGSAVYSNTKNSYHVVNQNSNHVASQNNYHVANQGGVVGFLPIASGSGHLRATCAATAAFKARYPYADRYCITQCQQNKCPTSAYCTDACRNK